MKEELKVYLQDLALEQLMKSPAGEKMQYAMDTFEEVQKHLYALSEKQGEETATTIKVGTIMAFAIMRKIYDGTIPADLTQEDWKDIAHAVSEYAILPDDQQYVKFVFGMYERYIRFSVAWIEGFSSEETVNAIVSLADELAYKTEQLNDEQIEEVKYIEDCLWISLEAMIKLLSAMAVRVMGEDYGAFAQALATYAFEYGRLMLYKREQEILDEFLQSQYEMDEELERKYSLFIEELEKQASQFYVLIDNAFVPDFRETFLKSILLAKAAGVEEDEILKSVEEIDEFFM